MILPWCCRLGPGRDGEMEKGHGRQTLGAVPRRYQRPYSRAGRVCALQRSWQQKLPFHLTMSKIEEGQTLRERMGEYITYIRLLRPPLTTLEPPGPSASQNTERGWQQPIMRPSLFTCGSPSWFSLIHVALVPPRRTDASPLREALPQAKKPSPMSVCGMQISSSLRGGLL